MASKMMRRPSKGRVSKSRGAPSKAAPKSSKTITSGRAGRIKAMGRARALTKVRTPNRAKPRTITNEKSQVKRKPAAAPRPAPKASIQPTDVNPIWALYRSIGDRIREVTGG